MTRSTFAEGPATLERIERTHAPLKIVLKTRDDPFFLEEWLRHHGALVGPENLVVLDNASTDERVLALYDASRERTPILHLDGYYNDVHSPARFDDLYGALRAGSDYFLFLDTDEFLAFSDGTSLRAGKPTPDLLPRAGDGDFIPTTRLNCVPLYRDRFSIGTDDLELRRQLKWSKPIVRAASSGWPDLINCNLHLHGALAPRPQPGWFVMHLNQFSPEQRIRNNVNKLVARGFMRPDEPLEAVVARDVPEGAWMIGIYIEEIRRMLPLRGHTGARDAPIAAGTFAVAADGRLAFASAVEETVFRTYVDRFADVVQEVIVEGRWPTA